MFFIVKSKSPYLLARLSADLQFFNYKPNSFLVVSLRKFIELEKATETPFDKKCEGMKITPRKDFFFFTKNWLHGFCDECRFWLTEKNYNKVLSEILK